MLKALSLYFSSLTWVGLEHRSNATILRGVGIPDTTAPWHLGQDAATLCLHARYQTSQVGTSLVVQWLRLHVSNTRGVGSNPGWASRIPHATERGQGKKPNKKPHRSLNQEPWKAPLYSLVEKTLELSCERGQDPRSRTMSFQKRMEQSQVKS